MNFDLLLIDGIKVFSFHTDIIIKFLKILTEDHLMCIAANTY